MTPQEQELRRLSRFWWKVALVMFIGAAVTWTLALTLPAQATKGDTVHGSLTWYHTNSHGAATHHGDSKPTFVQGAVLRLTKGSHHTWVRVNDVCDGSACRTLDVDPSTFSRLGSSSGKGVIGVTIECGKRGTKPMRKCLAGEG